MIGVPDYQDLIALVLQLLDYFLGSSDQDASAVDNFQAAPLCLAEYLRCLTVGADQHSSAVWDLGQAVGYLEPLLLQSLDDLGIVD
jgi:hypothetical protein